MGPYMFVDNTAHSWVASYADGKLALGYGWCSASPLAVIPPAWIGKAVLDLFGTQSPDY